MRRTLLLSFCFYSCLLAATENESSNDLPAYILKLPASVTTVLIADTGSASLHRYVSNGQGLKFVEAQRMSIGQNGAGKEKTGDRKSPLGIYFVLEELDTSNLHEKYGPVAFPLDYPNAWDSLNQKTGSGIWIHGVTPGSGARPERDTDGCIALPNEQLLLLQPHLTPLQTPVIVTRHIQTLSAQEISSIRDDLLAALELWSNSYRSGDWNQFLSMYHQDFEYRGMSREEWSAYRVQTVGARQIDEFSVGDILLLADPEDNKLYLSRFRQVLIESGRKIATTKRLYWRKTEQGELRIVAEDNG